MEGRSTLYEGWSIDQPPSSKNSGARPYGNWSRSGCLTCKKRRKKCDEKKPRCGNCIRLGRVCEGYVTLWQKPFEPSTKTSHHQKPLGSRAKPASVSHHQNDGTLTVYHGGSFSHEDSESTEYASMHTLDIPHCTNSSANKSTTGYELIRSPPELVSSTELYYLQYHAERGSRLMSNLETSHNPLQEVLLPRAFCSSLVQDAICTMSASHMANGTSLDQLRLRNAEITYHGRTLSGVRNALAKLPKQDMLSSSHMTLVEEIILAVASVCKYEAVRGNIKSWRGHLEALQSLVDYCGGYKNMDVDIADWVSGLVIYWQHIAKITNPKFAAGLVFCDGLYDAPKVDLYLGCSEQLVKICSRISDLRFFAHSTAALVKEVTEINNILISWSCDEQDFIIPKGISKVTFKRLKVIADYYRYGAFIFLHSTIEGISQSSLLELQGSQSTFWDMVHSLVAFTKPVALQHLVSLLRSFPPDSHPEFSGLVFPLFIAGCECEDNEQLTLILKSLHTLEVNFGIHNTKRAQELLVILSQLRCEGKPKHWLDLLEELEWELILV